MHYLKNPIVKKFGQRVRELRVSKKMSQGDLAKILGVHRTYVSGIERGLRNPSLLTLKKISKALDVNISDIVDSI